MQAVTFQAPGEVQVEERPEPELLERDDAVVRVEATGVCGSDLHIYHGRVQIEPGFTLGHEFVGTVVAAGDGVTQVAEGDRVLGCYCSACGNCFFCRRGDFHKCDEGRVFGHGKTLGSLQGAQAEQVLVPHANLTLRRVPEGMSDDIALFAGDVMGTGWHAVDQANIRPGRHGRGARPRSGRPLRGAGRQGGRRGARGGHRHRRGAASAGRVLRGRGGPPHRGRPACRREGRHRGPRRGRRHRRRRAIPTRSSSPAASRARPAPCRAIGVYAERIEVHMGIVWIKALTLKTGHANVIGHVDRVLAMLDAGVLDPGPLVTHHMKLEDAAEAYAVYDRREALKIVMTP